MWGSDDPNNRKPMVWADLEQNDDPENRTMPDVLQSYKRMIALRREYKALRTGKFETILTDDQQDVWMYRRVDEDEEILVAINASERHAEIQLPEGEWISIYADVDSDAQEDGIAPLSGRVWKKA
jgi:glycosidase